MISGLAFGGHSHLLISLEIKWDCVSLFGEIIGCCNLVSNCIVLGCELNGMLR